MQKCNENNDRSNLGVVRDSSIKLIAGPVYAEHLQTSCDVKSSRDGKSLLSIAEVKELWKEIHGAESLGEMEAKPRKKVYLHELLMRSEVLLPKLEIPERNPELELRVAGLRNYLADKEYQRMTQNVNGIGRQDYNPDDSIGFQIKQMNSALIAVFQFVISIACAFFFGFKGVELFIGELELAVKLLLGIGVALIVGSAELYFLAVNFAVSEEAASKLHVIKATKTTSRSPSVRPVIPNPDEHLKTS